MKVERNVEEDKMTMSLGGVGMLTFATIKTKEFLQLAIEAQHFSKH
jgi:hypothetical protein